MRFDGKVALVTGAAGGLGAETARALGAEGATVIVTDLDGEGAARVAAEIREAGSKAESSACDQTVEADVQSLFDDVVGQYDRLDACFANAGWGSVKTLLDISLEEWRRTIDINVTGTFAICQAAAKRMVDCGNGGAIVVTSSSGAVIPTAWMGAYCTAKASLNMLVSVLAYELGSYDIRVNAVMPGVIATPMTQSLLDSGAGEQVRAGVPLGRVGAPADIANTVTFLLSDDSSYITGTSLLIDGGGGIGGDSWFSHDFRRRGTPSWELRRLNPLEDVR